MSLNIKNAEAEELARRLAAATGESVTRAVTVAVRERLHREDDRQSAERLARIRALAADTARRWVEPYRSADHDSLLYDESGLPG